MNALSQFRSARARLQRYADAQFFVGWVIDLTPDQAIISIEQARLLMEGDELQVEIHGLKNTLTLTVTFETPISGNAHLFLVKGFHSTRISDAGARYRVKSYEAMVQEDALSIEGFVDNVSESGVGLRMRAPLQKGAAIRIQVLLPRGEMELDGVVVHNAEMDMSGLDYRVGVRLELNDRIGKARWVALLKDVAEAA